MSNLSFDSSASISINENQLTRRNVPPGTEIKMASALMATMSTMRIASNALKVSQFGIISPKIINFSLRIVLLLLVSIIVCLLKIHLYTRIIETQLRKVTSRFSGYTASSNGLGNETNADIISTDNISPPKILLTLVDWTNRIASLLISTDHNAQAVNHAQIDNKGSETKSLIRQGSDIVVKGVNLSAKMVGSFANTVAYLTDW